VERLVLLVDPVHDPFLFALVEQSIPLKFLQYCLRFGAVFGVSVGAGHKVGLVSTVDWAVEQNFFSAAWF
jgi:hypothetical protein